MFETARVNLSDVVAIPVTPFRAGAIDEPALIAVLERMLDAGVRVFTPNGNTGEFYALQSDERRRVLDITSHVVGARGHIVAGIGFDQATAIDEGRYAANAGAAYVMLHQPVHPYISRDGWLDYHATIAAALPEAGVVLYVRNTWVDGEMIGALVERAPNVVGVKYAVADAAQFARVRAHAPELTWIAGLAEPYAPSYFAHGATGFTSGLVNVSPHLSLDLLQRLQGGDFSGARRLTDRIAEFEDLRAANGSANNVSIVKEALAQLGIATREVRSPSSAVDDASAQRVGAILDDWSRDYALDVDQPVEPVLA